MSFSFSDDTLLGGRIRFRQPKDGYRVAIDPLFLAAAVPARDGERVLDAGAGAGAAALALALRVPGARVTGVEIDEALVALATENSALNGMGERVAFIHGDILTAGAEAVGQDFDHAMCNPPYLDRVAVRPPPDATKALATVEGPASLAHWIAYAVAKVRWGGTVTLIHRADRLDQVLAALCSWCGGIIVYPLWPKAGRAAKRVLVAGRRGSAAPLTLAPGLVLHRSEGPFTDQAEAVLRRGTPLDLGWPRP